jgi:DNA-binding transcriptional MerR regulator
MKINELAKITQVNPETIRMYRKMGFLDPRHLPNGYYDYSITDFSGLVYLRKMRSYGMSLEDIRNYENSSDPTQMIQQLEEEEKTIHKQLLQLKEMQRFLELEKRHVLESVQVGRESVQLMQSVDEKLDYYGEEDIMQALKQLDSDLFYMTTTSTIRISKEILNGEVKDQIIPIEAGIGMYRYMIRRKHMQAPEHASIVPNGVCISQIISLRSCEEMNLLQLAPMIEYAKTIHKPFLSDTTGYLARIRHDDKGTILDFRIRACIEENDIVDPETIDRKK